MIFEYENKRQIEATWILLPSESVASESPYGRLAIKDDLKCKYKYIY